MESKRIWKGYNAGSIRVFEERTGIESDKRENNLLKTFSMS